ncbi:hypothetical protein TthWC1_2290 [Thermoanaerobacter thermohydrosulfuricus WC1]|uniref:Uncharacterized protein n=1 Tax=Thermoanaerobacter thermohydrosulfuricus WC1 TaxID=1198630 RepID=M8CLV0_THETY|nr:hypothetical protein [Thermoanaerobacter thermohydrosulfuricus]EMT38195.1 hypothetical protein TthWC1_2290 [Thermoanaerobacter thermohydrosulfuricus WC1]
MTVAIGVIVSEGIILAGDSRTIYANSRGWLKIASDYTELAFLLPPLSLNLYHHYYNMLIRQKLKARC